MKIETFRRNKLTRTFIFIIIFGLILLSVQQVTQGIFLQGRPLSQKLVQNFLMSHNIQPLVLMDVNNEMSVALYKTPVDMGYYILYRNGIFNINSNDIGFKLVSTSGYEPSESPAKSPVSVLVGRMFDTQIVGITINDNNLLIKIYSMKIIFPDGSATIIPIQNRSAIIFPMRPQQFSFRYKKIILYDKSNQELLQRSQ